MTDAERNLRVRVVAKIVNGSWTSLPQLAGLAIEAMKEQDLLIANGEVLDAIEVDHHVHGVYMVGVKEEVPR